MHIEDILEFEEIIFKIWINLLSPPVFDTQAYDRVLDLSTYAAIS